MAFDAPLLLALNRGMVSRLGLARVDVDRIALSAEEQTNFMPRVLGSASFRPGLRHIGSTRDDLRALHLPFVFSKTDTALIELTEKSLRIRRGSDEAIVSRDDVDTAISNGTFDSDLTGWTDADQGGAVSAWVTGGFMGLTGTGFNEARRTQAVTVATADENILHALRVVVERGPVTLRVKGPSEVMQISQAAGTPLGSMFGNGGLSAAFNGNTSQTNAVSATAFNVSTANIGKDWGAGNSRIITGFRVYPTSDDGFVGGGTSGQSITITLEGSDDNFSSTNVLGTLNTTDPDNEFRELFSGITVSTAYRYHRLVFTLASGAAFIFASEVQFYETVAVVGATPLVETELGTGTHSITFRPSEDFTVEIAAARQYQALVDSVTIEATGATVLPAPWAEADLPLVRYAQSRDVVFISAAGYPPYRLERRDNDSWSLVRYEPEDGPFKVENVGPISIASSAITGDVTLTASRSLFRSSHVDALFRLTSFGQEVEATFSGEDQFSDPIRVTGVGSAQRTFTHALTSLTSTGTTVTLQRSVGEPGAWLDVASFTTDGSRAFNDGLDNQIIYYRLGVKSGDYSTGTIDLAITYATSGTITGVVRIAAVASEVSASAIVLKSLGGVDGTTSWSEGEWSDKNGWPSAVAFYEGRLWWMGHDRQWGSASDAFDVFDDTIEGDSAPISRSIGSGPTEAIHWILPLQRLLFGAQLAAFSARSSSFDEPLTPTAFSLRRISTQGTANVDAVAVDDNGYYAQAAGSRVYELSLPDGRFDYSDVDVTAIVPEICEPGIVRLAVQRQPDTRLHAVLSDGTAAVMVTDRAEGVRAWIKIETAAGDLIEDVAVLPGSEEDRVYYSVQRDSSRFLERLAAESEARGANLTTLMDSHVVYQGTATTTIPVAHLEGRSVVAWADGASVDDANGDPLALTVSSGVVTLPVAASVAAIGLSYDWRFKSTKLAFAASVGTAIGMRRRISKVGLVLADTHARGIRYGQSFDVLDDMPAFEDGAEVDSDQIWDEYDRDAFTFPGEWTTDSRICLTGASPRPATVLAVPFVIEGHRSF